MNKSVNNSVNMKKNSRLGQLQTLRFFAFMLIFLWHGDVWCNRFFPRGNGGAMAVSFFFILSGFVVGYSCYGKKIKVSAGEMGKYMKKKILKLYPLYLLTTLFAAVFSELPACLLRGDFKGMLTPGTQLLKNLFLVQSWFPANKGYFSYNSLGWFLSSLMFLYLINIPLMALLNKYRPNMWKLVISAFGLYAVIVLYSYGVRNTNMEFWAYIMPLSRIWEYLIGIVLGYGIVCMKMNNDSDNKNRVHIIATFLEIACFGIWVGVLYTKPVPDWTSRVVWWIIPNVILIVVYSLGMGLFTRAFQNKVLVFLGNISFELYLIHQLVIKVYSKLPIQHKLGPLKNVMSLVICFAMTVLAAYIYNRLETYYKKSC